MLTNRQGLASVLQASTLVRLSLISGLVGRVIRTEQPLLFDDIVTDPRYRRWSKSHAALKAGFRSGLYLPIKTKGKVVGVLGFLSRDTHRFLPGEIRLIDCIVDHLGTAVENSQLYETVERSRRQLQSLAERMHLAREEERTRLARDLHDEMGQALAALKMEIDALTDSSQDCKRRQQSKHQAFHLINEMVTAMRRIAANLRPAILNDLDLTTALKQYAREFQERTGVRCRMKSMVKEHSLDQPRAIAVLRILQEALNNVQRHSDADRVDIEWRQSGSTISLKIHDNGKGIKKTALRQTESFGIIGMRERALLCGGTLDISGERSSGTTVRACIPSRSLARKSK